MSDFKEFQGKTLDAAIAEACAYYDAPREKLEIDIVEDAKTGIFGLVGARKARIRARRAQLPDMGESPNRRTDRPRSRRQAPDRAEAPSDAPAADHDEEAGAAPREASPDRAPEHPSDGGERPRGRGRKRASRSEEEAAPANQATGDGPDQGESLESGAEEEGSAGRGRPARRGPSSRAAGHGGESGGQDGDTPARASLAELDHDRLREVTMTVLRKLVTPILGEEEVSLEVRVGDDRVQAQIQSEDTGLLIGRDGQNLAAVQYLAARIISRAMDAPVRVQVDAGDYHSRQDARLQELALDLADRVRSTGRPQSTRPLSAYQRRVIHLTLQDAPDVQTRSSGEGALKRVIVQPRRESD